MHTPNPDKPGKGLKLQKLSYHSSYSHKGKYFTLDETADFHSQDFEPERVGKKRWDYTLMA
jgi:hypothetical protein